MSPASTSADAARASHAVALVDGQYADQFESADAGEIADWYRHAAEATVVGVDAPCRWSADGQTRIAERQLMAVGISCFLTPTRAKALAHPKDYFGWMLRGEELYRELEQHYPPAASFFAYGEPSTGWIVLPPMLPK